MAMSFTGNALITGAGSGIGRALSLALARTGVHGIALADRNTNAISETERLIKEIKPDLSVLRIPVDVADEKSVEDMVQKTVSQFGSINYAANVAGLSPPKDYPTSEMPVETYDQVSSVNSRGVFLCMRAQLRAMENQPFRESSLPYLAGLEERGTIVNVASLAGIAGVPRMSPYVSSKHAVVGLTKTAALEYGRAGIRVNAVCPGYIETPMIAEFMAKRGVSESDPAMKTFQGYAAATNPQGRMGKPEEVAEACAWLLSPQSSYINGIALAVDGGVMSASSFYKPT